MPTFKVTLAYDGTSFVGWQRQAAGTSVQGLLEEALRALDDRAVAVAGAGRTDAGVHALGQVASFTLHRTLTPDALIAAVNARLPIEVRVLAAEQVDPSFHPRFDARAKSYRYRIWNAETINPFERHYAWHVSAPLAIDRMQDGARRLVGRRNFAAFQTAGGAGGPTERTILSSSVTSEPGLAQRGCLITYDIVGDGFLRHMVRAIVGSLVEIGREHRDPSWIDTVMDAADRAAAGPTAPPHGLFLVGVTYDMR